MQVIIETIFDIAYLFTIALVGILILIASKKRKEYVLYGIMALVLVFGDSFHLVPRVIAINTNGVENHTASLGFGTFVASITMTVFYVMLYKFWQIRYKSSNKMLSATIYILAFMRIVLCLFPQNKWLEADSPVIWGIYRNIPFLIIGVIMIIIFYKKAKEFNDKNFRFMWLAILLSFLFYIPVVLFSSTVPAVGAFMLPKTCAYVWIIMMGYRYVINKSIK